MIRSFSYVAHAGLNKFLAAPETSPNVDKENLSAWARQWQNSASSEFLSTYRETIAANPALLPAPQQAQRLLEAYLLRRRSMNCFTS